MYLKIKSTVNGKENWIHMINSQDTIRVVKDKIFNQIGIPVQNQYLQYYNKTLENDNDVVISDYNIEEYDTIDLTPIKGKGQITINYYELATCNSYEWYVDPNLSIHNLHRQEYILQQLHYCSSSVDNNDDNVRMVLMFNGKNLTSAALADDGDDDKNCSTSSTLSEYNITDNSTIHIAMLLPKVKIRISTNDEEFVINDVYTNDTILSMKEKIYNQIGFPIQNQSLQYHRYKEGIIGLDDEKKKFSDYFINIREGENEYALSTLLLVLRPKPGKDEITIFIHELSTGTIYERYVNPSCSTIRGLRNHYNLQKWVPNPDFYQQSLLFNGNIIHNNNNDSSSSGDTLLSEYNICKDKSTIHLVRLMRIKIRITTNDNTFYVEDMNPYHDTISTVKKKIHDEIGFPIKNQMLQFYGKDLTDDMKTLSDNGIEYYNAYLDVTPTEANDDGDIVLYFKEVLTDKTYEWYVNPTTTTILELKTHYILQNWVKTPLSQQILMFNGIHLKNDSCTLTEYGITRDQSTIVVAVMLKLEIRITTNDNVLYIEDVKSYDTINNVKEKIYSRTGFPTKNQLLQYNGINIQNNNERTVSDYGIKGVWPNPPKLTLTPTKSEGQITIYIKRKNDLLNDVVYEWYADPSSAISHIKKPIQHLVKDTPPGVVGRGGRQQIAMFHGVNLNNKYACTLQEIGIKDMSTIILLTRMEFEKYHLLSSPSSNHNFMEQQKSGCIIPETELRGITLNQLMDVVLQIYGRCDEEGWKSTTDGKVLKPEDVTLYDLSSNFIKTITAKHKCSYVEMVANSPQKPKWFVSHWWGEPVLDFVRCIQQHAYDRNLGDDTPYWVCAYANNQHELKLPDNPKDSSFSKAMHLSEGTVSILDRLCVCYTRIWCSFEVYLANVELPFDQFFISNGTSNENDRHLYDVYTVRSTSANKPVGITDGCVASDKYHHNDDDTLDLNRPLLKDRWVVKQANRQQLFPLDICSKALAVSLESADATCHADKIRILNYVSRNSEGLDADPPVSHESYETVNRLLRGKFAGSMYRHALEAERDTCAYRTALSRAPLRKLVISFSGCNRIVKEATRFFHSLPLTLEMIDFDFSDIVFRSLKEYTVNGIGRLANLKFIKLSYRKCSGLSDGIIHELLSELRSISNLLALSLDLSHNEELYSLRGLDDLVSSQPNLSSLKLNLSHCIKTPDADEKAINVMYALAYNLNKTVQVDINFDGSCSWDLCDLASKHVKTANDLLCHLSKLDEDVLAGKK